MWIFAKDIVLEFMGQENNDLVYLIRLNLHKQEKYGRASYKSLREDLKWWNIMNVYYIMVKIMEMLH